jgi:hypothetical protein
VESVQYLQITSRLAGNVGTAIGGAGGYPDYIRELDPHVKKSVQDSGSIISPKAPAFQNKAAAR